MGHSSSPDLTDLCERHDVDDKAMRAIHGFIKEGRAPASLALAKRSGFLAKKSWERRMAPVIKCLKASAISAMRDDPSITGFAAERIASCGSIHASIASLAADAGSLAPSLAPKALRDAFLLRRIRHDWARRLRADHGGPLFSDPLALSMLRLVEPAEADGCLAGLLLHSALSLDPDSAACAMSLGADPLGTPSAFFCQPFGRTRMNTLGAALTRFSSAPFHPHSRLDSDIEKDSDESTLGSCSVLIGCCPAQDLGKLLSLGARGARAIPQRNALELSAHLSLLHCARAFQSMGLSMDGIPSPKPWDDPRIPAERAQAFRALACQSLRDDLHGLVPAAPPPCARMRI